MRMHGPQSNHALRLCAGDIVEVRSAREILETLDANGNLEALPFMPEMLQYCGKRFRVYKRADKTCDTIEKTGLRRMTAAVHLEGVRCDGQAHGGCQAGCLLFWKEAWLRKVDPDFVRESEVQRSNGSDESDGTPEEEETGACTVAALMKATHAATDVSDPESEKFRCQATELRTFTSPLSPWDVRQYVRDLWSGNVGLADFVRGIAVLIFNAIQERRRGRTFPFDVQGKLTKTTPAAFLGLQPGELVQVKTKEEILQTLDRNNKNRGLWFDIEMLKYCEGKYRVLRRVEKIINERTGKMMKMPNDCLILEGVICTADYHAFCPRSIYPYWREIWLKRAESESKGS